MQREDAPHSHLVLLLSYTAGPPALAISAVSPSARVAVESCTLTGFVAPGLQIQCVVRRDHRIRADPCGYASSSSSEDEEREEDGSNAYGEHKPDLSQRRVRKQWRSAQLSPSARGAYMFVWSHGRRQASCARGVRAGGLAAPPALSLVPGLLGREGIPGEGVVSRRLPHAQVIRAHLEHHHAASEVCTGMFSVSGRTPQRLPWRFPRSRASSSSSSSLLGGVSTDADVRWIDGNEVAAHTPVRVLFVTVLAPPGTDAHDSAEKVSPPAALMAALWWLARPLIPPTSAEDAGATAYSPGHVGSVLPLGLFVVCDEEAAQTTRHEDDGSRDATRSRHAPLPSSSSSSRPDGQQPKASAWTCPLGALFFPTCANDASTLLAGDANMEGAHVAVQAAPTADTHPPGRTACCHDPPCDELLFACAYVSPDHGEDGDLLRRGVCAFRRAVRVVACDFDETPASLTTALLSAMARSTHTAAAAAAMSTLAPPGSTRPRTVHVMPLAVEELRLRGAKPCAWLTKEVQNEGHAEWQRARLRGASGGPALNLYGGGGWGATVLSHLRVLDLRRCSSVENLRWLLRTSTTTAVVTAAAPHLQVLDISFCEFVSDLSPLAYLRSLRVLRAACLPELSSLTWLLDSAKAVVAATSEAACVLGGGLALEELVLVDCGLLVDLYPIGVLRRLRRLLLTTSFDLPPAHMLASDRLDAMRDPLLNADALADQLLPPRPEQVTSTYGDGHMAASRSTFTETNTERRSPVRLMPMPRDADTIDALRCAEDDLSWIQHCADLVVLSLRGRAHLRTVDAIGALFQLEHLDLTNCTYVRSLSWIACCTQLRRVKLGGCVRITDWTPLARLPHLVSVDVDCGGYRARQEAACAQRSADARMQIELAARRPDLTADVLSTVVTHRLSWVALSSRESGTGTVMPTCTTRMRTRSSPSAGGASTVDSHKYLRVLDIAYLEESIGNLTLDQALRRATRVRLLDLRGCAQLQTLTWAFQLPRLRELVLFDCPALSDFAALGALSTLERLFLSDTAKVEAMPWIASCHRLREAYFVNVTALNDLRALARLKHLKTLAVTHSAVSDLSWLMSSPSSISSSSPTTFFPSLVDLDLSYSARLTDVRALGVIRQLRRLRLASCTALHSLGPPLPPLSLRVPHMGPRAGHRSHSSPDSTRPRTPSLSPQANTHVSHRQHTRTWFDVRRVVWPSAYAQSPTSTANTADETAVGTCMVSLKASAATPVAAVGIGGCLALEDVDLSRSALLSDLSPLGRLPQLRRIRADNTALKSLRWLPLCHTLTHLDATGTPLVTRAQAAIGPQETTMDTLTPGLLLRREFMATAGSRVGKGDNISQTASDDDAFFDLLVPPHLVWWNGASLRAL